MGNTTLTKVSTDRQLSYIRSLAVQAGREVELDGLSKKDASALIDELKTLAYAAA